MHVNVWAEQWDNYSAKLVEKKGFVGLQIVFLTNPKYLDEDNPQLTVWSTSKERLAAILATLSAFAEKGSIATLITGSKELKPSGTLGE